MKPKKKTVEGPARIANRQGDFHAPPPAGSVLVVDLPDLDVEGAETLVAFAPTAVLNASPSRTGRSPATGTRMILDAGIPVVDNLGGSITGLTEGEIVSISGAEVTAPDGFIAHGRQVTASGLAFEDDRVRLGARIESYALSTWSSFNQEADLILDGLGLPALPVLKDRVVIIVPPVADTRQLKKTLVRLDSYDPIIVAVGAGANQVDAAKKRPEIIVGDAADIENSVLKKAKTLVLSTAPSEQTSKSLKQHSIGYEVVFTELADKDVALLIAYHAGARVIVDASRAKSVSEFFDRDVNQTVGDLLTHIEVSDRLVTADAAMAFDRSPVSGWLLALLLVVAIAAAGTAVLLTPWGQSLLALITTGGFFG